LDEGILLSTFFITYGFVGLEYVSMELDDPFGDDPNDFDDLGMAEVRPFALPPLYTCTVISLLSTKSPC